MRTCQDCNKEIKNNNKITFRCLSCHKVFRKRNLLTKHYCQDCGIETEKKGRSKRCGSCATKNQERTPAMGFQKGHGLMGNNPTSRGRTWKLSDETKSRQSEGQKKSFRDNPERKKFINVSGLIHDRGEKHPRWVEDRSKVRIKRKEMSRFEYKNWMKDVKKRDNHMCCISNKDCNGRLEVHHILNWKDFPELRYEVNNGITLCHFHHPIGRAKESNMSPYFQEIVKNKIQ
jgi:hypothetical protein